jgi:hypothetical protein
MKTKSAKIKCFWRFSISQNLTEKKKKKGKKKSTRFILMGSSSQPNSNSFVQKFHQTVNTYPNFAISRLVYA